MTGEELRRKFVAFFVSKQHTEIPSASLIPENDPSVLFTTAGMHPLVPYLLGAPHPAGKRLVNIQKCVRTTDIEEVGDNRHLTFFEMLGNWSLGDYFKRDAIVWSYEFLTHSEWLGLNPAHIAVSIFKGDESAEADEESLAIWKSIGIPKERIVTLGKSDNWWPAGGKHAGPQGPDTEMFYWTGNNEAPKSFDPKNLGWVEVWNNVFMQFTKDTTQGKLCELSQKNVDTGMGLERILAVTNGVQSVFDTDLFAPIFELLATLGAPGYDISRAGLATRSLRIIADHLKAATFIIGDDRGVSPSNVDQGYIVRRLIRRAIRHARAVGIAHMFTAKVAEVTIAMYGARYPELTRNKRRIVDELQKEEEKFTKTLAKGLKEFEKMTASVQSKTLSGESAFFLFSTYGFPFELTQELLHEKGISVDENSFQKEFEKHRTRSRESAGQKFLGGLADTNPRTVHGHTATHLLHQALRVVLGNHVEQRGSNINAQRIRFDFTHSKKISREELDKVESIINEQITRDLPVHFEMLTVVQAKEAGAIGLFEDTYATIGDAVKVYSIGDFSKEICGGPHVAHTGEIGSFKIIKEEAVSAGVRRIKAIVE